MSRRSRQSRGVRLEITRRADLAVRTMRVLGDAPDRLKAHELAKALCSTPGFVPQVVGPLVRAGWVRSDPGPSGGYALSVSLDPHAAASKVVAATIVMIPRPARPLR